MKTSIVLAALAAVAGSAFGAQVQSISYIGQETFPTGFSVLGTNMGGLSGLAYNAATGGFLAISDDRSQVNPARFYGLNIDVADGALTPGDVSFTSVTFLKRPDGSLFPNGNLDPEGIALDASGRVWVSSEGDVNQNPQLDPFVRAYDASGNHLAALPVPSKFLPTPGNSGIRNNLAFETLTLSPSGASLFTATENALKQDGPAAAVGVGSNCRILRYDTATNLPAQEYVYMTDPVADAPVPPGSFATNGLVDMLALDEQNFIAIERSFSTGVGNAIKLYEVSIAGATDVSGVNPLSGSYTAASKTLIFDLATLGLTLDNIEGLAFGPTLPNGDRTLVVVSDNNFSATQFTQFLAFRVTVPAPGAVALSGVAMLAGLRRRR